MAPSPRYLQINIRLSHLNTLFDLQAQAQLPSEESVSLHLNQQGHHPLGLDLSSNIPSKLVNAKGKLRLYSTAPLALSAISSS